MTNFENTLIEKGYIKCILDCKTMKYFLAKNHQISSTTNLDFRYIPKTDNVFLDKIKKGKKVTDEDFTWNDRKNEICFGLHEANKPPTLIYPRPKIRVKRNITIDGVKHVVVENETFDNSMNLVLSKENPEKILKFMFDENLCFSYDLTK